MALHLRRVDSSNLWELLDLSVTKEQEEADFVASNSVSILEAYACLVDGKHALPFGLYDGEVPVGFLMLGYDSQEGDPEIASGNYCPWRLMVDARYQRQGYGRRAVELALDCIRAFPCGPAELCWLSYTPENTAARELYHSLGFRETGELVDEELVAVLPLAGAGSETEG